MRLLFVTPYLPSPPVYGGQRRIHGLVTRLARSHTVSVIGLTYSREPYEEAIAETRTYAEHVIVVPEDRHRIDGRKKRMLQLASLASPLSWEHMQYHRPLLQKAIDEHLAAHDYDAIVVEFAFMACYRFQHRSGSAPPLLVLDEHNVEFDLLRRTASATTLVRRLFHAVNWRKLRREETRTWREYHGVALASARDEGLVKAALPEVATAVVPNGVDVEGFAPMPEVTPEPLTILFFGAMNYYPNTDAALFFVREVMPLLRARHPQIQLRIVGDVGDSPVRGLHGGAVNVVGFVKDVRVEIARAAVVIAPLRIGGGTRLKILEAMSMSKAIVATHIGAEGIDVRHEHDILLADEPADLADAVSRLLMDRALSSALGSEARKTAMALYGWEASAGKLERFIDRLRSAR